MPQTTPSAPPLVMDAAAERALLSKVSWRLIPFMVLLYIVAYLDRVNLSFAKLDMTKDLGFSEAVIGLGGGLFFFGYFVLEIPSNLILERVGARVWIARIMVTWGIIASAMMFVKTVPVFYSMRILLGLAEAGFFPGMILYLTYWFPAHERAKAVSRFMIASVSANIIGSLISGPLLKMEGQMGLHGWQWLFLLEGIPSVILGVLVLFLLPNGPKDAKWLAPHEREWILHRLHEEPSGDSHKSHDLTGALKNGQVWLLCLLYFGMATGFYGFTLYLPTIVEGAFPSFDKGLIGIVSAIPYVLAVAGLLVIGHHSDHTGERKGHIVFPALLGVGGVGVAAALLSPGALGLSPQAGAALAVGSLTIAAFGMYGTLGPFWTLPNALLSGTAAAGGIALINSVGNLGGFFGPTLIGYVLQGDKKNFTGALSVVVAAFLLVAIVAATVRVKKTAGEAFDNAV